MAFAIKLKGFPHWIERHISLTTRSFGTRAKAEDIEIVQADGDELQYIKENFAHIPIGPAVVAKWRGEMAQFIFENLPY